MGKFPPSTIHNWFSKWHWQNCGASALLTDIDRLWVEVRGGKPIAVFDLKWDDNPEDSATYCEDIVSEWFESKGVPYYVVRVELEERGFARNGFHIHRGADHLFLSEGEMINWINDNLPPSYVSRNKMEE